MKGSGKRGTNLHTFHYFKQAGLVPAFRTQSYKEWGTFMASRWFA